MLKIRDISHYDFDNGATIDFSQYDGFMIKATEGGDYVDPEFENNIARVKAAGKPFGFYHYFSFVTDVQTQINNFLTHTSQYHAALRPSLDVETDGRNNKVYPADHKDRVHKALAGIPYVMLYSDIDGLAHLDASHGAYPLWLAEYVVSQPKDVDGFTRIGWQYQENPDINTFTEAVYLAPPAPPRRQGDPVVKLYQQELNRLKIGTALTVDGINGALTRAAVQLFEKIEGLTVDAGIWGSQCQNTYLNILGKRQLKYVFIFSEPRGNDVRYVQYRVGAAIDGVYGSKTAGAVKAWQKKNGLNADSIAGPATWLKLIG